MPDKKTQVLLNTFVHGMKKIGVLYLFFMLIFTSAVGPGKDPANLLMWSMNSQNRKLNKQNIK